MTADEMRAWREAGLRYNAAFREGLRQVYRPDRHDGAEIDEALFDDPRSAEQGAAVIDALRSANAAGTVDEFRQLCPPAHEPIIPILNHKGRAPRALVWLDDELIAVTVPNETGHSPARTCWVLSETEATSHPTVQQVGCSQDRRAWVTVDGPEGSPIRLRDARIDGAIRHEFPWPHAELDLPPGYVASDDPVMCSHPTILPFSSRDACLFVSESAVYLLDREHGVQRLLPTRDQAADFLADFNDDEKPSIGEVPMAHASISPDEQWIAYGSQDSGHHIEPTAPLFAGDRSEPATSIEPLSAYPHYAHFTADGRSLIVNSCHYYNGGTGIIARNADGTWASEILREPDPVSRVYAATSWDGHAAWLNAEGELLCFSIPDGEYQWGTHIGSSGASLAVSPNGKRLAASTYAGFVVVYDFAPGTANEALPGHPPLTEAWRWILWFGEPPLRW